MIRPLLDLLFPRRCVGCGREGGSWICQNCRVLDGKWNMQVAEGILALSPLREKVIREALHGLKYHSLHEVAEELVDMLWSAELMQQLPVDTVLVPVPASFARRRARGFNQAELLARALSRRSGFPVETRLLMKTSKGTQVGKSRVQRKATTFRRTITPLPEGTMLLVDDVCTTGSTLRACATVLDIPLRALVIAQD